MSRWIATLVLFVAATLAFARVLVGCDAVTNHEARSAAAEASYTAEMLACVDKFDTRAAINECRADVRKRWGVDGGAR